MITGNLTSNIATIVVEDILGAVHTECVQAMSKHGSMKSRYEAYAVLLEEVDEFWEEVKKNPAKMDKANEKQWNENMRAELTQIAAMAIRAIHDLGL